MADNSNIGVTLREDRRDSATANRLGPAREMPTRQITRQQFMAGTTTRQGTDIRGLADETRGQYPRVAGNGSIRSYKKGGAVRKTGLALLHKGERVLNKRQAI